MLLQEDISVLQNQTVMEHSGGGGSPATLGESVLALKEKMDSLTSTITSINASFSQHATDTSLTNHRLKVANLPNYALSFLHRFFIFIASGNSSAPKFFIIFLWIFLLVVLCNIWRFVKHQAITVELFHLKH